MPSRNNPLAVAPDEVAVRVAQLGEQFIHLEASLDEHKEQTARAHDEIKDNLKEIKLLVQAAVERGEKTDRKVEKYEFFGGRLLWLLGGLGAIVAWGLDIIPSAKQAINFILNHKG